MDTKASQRITSAQIEQALRSFQAHGGFIKNLPDQRVALLDPVSSRLQTFTTDLGLGEGRDQRLEDQ